MTVLLFKSFASVKSGMHSCSLVLLIFVSSLHGQIISDSLNTKVFHNNRIYVFDSNHHFIASSKIKFEDSNLSASDPNYEHFGIFHKNDKTYFVNQKDLSVYQLRDSVLFALTAVDPKMMRTQDHELFLFDNKIHTFTQSALNNFNNSFFYYDEALNEWTSLRHERSNADLFDLKDFQIVPQETRVYVFDGFKPAPDIPFKLNPNKQLFVYNFDTNKWSNKRWHNLKSLGLLATYSSKCAVFIDKTIGNFSLVNFESNGIYSVPLNFVFGKNTPDQFSLNNKNELAVFIENPEPKLDYINLAALFSDQEKNYPIYIDETTLIPWILILVILVLMTLAFSKLKNRHKKFQTLSFNGEKLWFGQKSVTLCVEHQKMMHFMLRGKTLETGDIVDLFSGKDYSVSHTHKLKNDLIRDLRQIILNLTDRDDILIIEKSQEDSRMSVYRLDLKQFDEGTLKAHGSKRRLNKDHQKEEE